MSKFLVTGGLGFIGHNVVEQLEHQNKEVIIVDSRTNYGVIPEAELTYLLNYRTSKIKTIFNYKVDVLDSNYVNVVLNLHKPDTVIHLASYPRQQVVNHDTIHATKLMLTGLQTFLEDCKNNGIKRFVFISSSMVYGNFYAPASESHVCLPVNYYGILKLAGEQLVRSYCELNDIDWIIVRPSAVYGPGDVTDRLVNKFFLGSANREKLSVFGPSEYFDMSYVTDVAKGIVSAASAKHVKNTIFNITKGTAINVLYIAQQVDKIVRKNNVKMGGRIDTKERDNRYPTRTSLNIDRAKIELNYVPVVDIDTGLEETYEWISNTPFWPR